MKLSVSDAKLFFGLMWSLQFFVNQKLQIFPDINSKAEYTDLPQNDKFQVRNALYKNSELFHEYLSTNPDNLTKDSLDIIEQWQYFINDNFVIERYLKKHAIFISNDTVYGVLGISDSFNDMFPKSHLPIYVKTVLLPFKDILIYDGLLEGYGVHLGSGVKQELKEQYLCAKQMGKIISSLNQGMPLLKQSQHKKQQRKKTINLVKELEQLSVLSKKLKGGQGQHPINGPVFSLVKASIELAKYAIEHPDDSGAIFKDLDRVERAINKVEDTIYRLN